MDMTLLFAMLVQSGLCAPVHFEARSGMQLTVLVCPLARQEPGAAGKASPDDAAPEGEQLPGGAAPPSVPPGPGLSHAPGGPPREERSL